MANKKISELDSRASLSLSDLMAVGDPSTGYLYKTTISDLKTLTGAGVISFNGRYGAVSPAEGDYSLTQLSDVIITTAANGNIIKYNGSNWVNVPMYSGTIAQYVDGTGAYQTFPTLLSSDRLLTEVRNTSGATMTKGTVVYLNGSSGTLPTIAKAQANAESTSTGTYGVVQNDIANNANGYVVVIGNLTGLDTSAYTAGDILWLSPSTAGGVTTTKPVAPDNAVYVGIVTRSNNSSGTIEVKIQNGYELDELHNVLITSVANNQGLFYDSATSLWKNKSISTVLGYTPQAQLNGTGFVKASGTTISYDNSTYVTTDTNQTISGIKIFSSTIYANDILLSAAGTASQTFLKNLSTAGTVSTGANLLGFNTDDNFYLASDGKGYAVFSFNNGGTGYTYTLPALSGTVALTSNLSSYLPLTGGTLTGALSGTSISLNSTGDDGLFVDHGGSRGIRINSYSAGYGLVINNASGSTSYPLAILSQGAYKILVNADGTSEFNAAMTLTGALNINAGSGYSTINTDAPSGVNFVFKQGGVVKHEIFTNSTQFAIYNTTTSAIALGIANATGAATFSSTITSNDTYGLTLGSVANKRRIQYGSDVATSFTFLTDANGYAGLYSSTINIKDGTLSGGGGFEMTSEAFFGARFQSNAYKFMAGNNSTEYMRITSSGNVGIGTSSPTQGKLVVSNSGPSIIALRETSVGVNSYWNASDGSATYFGNDSNHPLAFVTNATERMRITSGGNVEMYGNTLVKAASLTVGNNAAAGVTNITIQNNNNGYQFGINSDCTLFQFINGAPNVVATISGASGVYTALSDVNKKKDFENSTIGLNEILQLKPILYRFKDAEENSEKELGFIAQEVKEFIPQAYVESGEGDDIFIGLQDRPIIAALVKAVQELKAEIETLKNN